MKFLRKVFPREVSLDVRRNIIKSGYIRYSGYSFTHNLIQHPTYANIFNQFGAKECNVVSLTYDATKRQASNQYTFQSMSEDYYFTLTDIYVEASWTGVVDVTLEIDIVRKDTLEILDVIKLSYTSVNKVEFTKKYYNDTKKVFRIPANVQIQVIVTLTFSASITWGSGSFRVFQIRTPTRLINFDQSTNKYFEDLS